MCTFGTVESSGLVRGATVCASGSVCGACRLISANVCATSNATLVAGTVNTAPSGDNDIVPKCYVDAQAGRSTSCEFTSSCSWTIPSDVTKIWVSAIGGGGGGGGSSSAAYQRAGGGGGSGESVHKFEILVTGGGTLCIIIGAAGSAGTSCAAGGTGGSTYICDASDMYICVVGGEGGAGGDAIGVYGGCGGRALGS